MLKLFFDKDFEKKDFKEESYFMKLPSEVNLAELRLIAKEYGKIKNLIVCGTGGSISSLEVILDTVPVNKNYHLVDATHPELVDRILSKCKPKDSLVIVISKSGTTLEMKLLYLLFSEYHLIFITSGGVLKEVSQMKNIRSLEVPPVAGRFSAFSPVALLPAILLGVNIEELIKGAENFFRNDRKKAMELASYLFQFYRNGFKEIFFAPYSPKLDSLVKFLSQLVLEGLGKEGEGPTLYGGVGPRMQHEAFQRLMDGRRDVVSLFLKVEKFRGKAKIKVPEQLKELLGNYQDLSLGDAINYELQGTRDALIRRGVPSPMLSVSELGEFTTGELIAFFQSLAYYLAILFNVDPFTNPAVDEGKEITNKLISERK